MNYTFNIPSKWGELSPKQTKKALKILFSKQDVTYQKMQLLCLLLGISMKILKKKFNAFQIADCFQHIKFITNLELDANPIKTLKAGWLGDTFYSPGNDFEKLTLAEFTQADTYAAQFIETHDKEHLDNLCAVLYRPKGALTENRDIRIPFNEYDIEKRAYQLSKAPYNRKLVAFWWYSWHKQNLTKALTEVFKKPKKGEGKKGNGSWINFILGVAGSKFGDLKRTEETQALTVLYDANEQMKMQKELEAKRNKK